MMLARVFIGVALLICIVAPARAGDLEDLETAFETALETLNSRDLDHFLESWHPEAVLVARNYVFPVDRAKVEKEMWSELFGDLLSATKSASYTAVDVEFRVIGNTGIAWGLTQFFIEPKSGSSRSQNSRLTAIFHKTDGHWKIVAWHDSAYPKRVEPLKRN